ncbi:malate/lactate/ureidoglycolate dehydrogenase [Pseudorhodoplanes sinuspersici]|uniref:Malate/lactate/ureidoglycolate dehydrogenase n=1 Tax=Pseudorhodoplanes sinuspersici TaxID=1235591 RepID=A0A1W6ZJV3_9HYPH|nr:malate/lactate/ureidoglycolate dehydrogenase [Pseudorhodoplanes sinuspersici]ARP97666.1 malate/lactate/ureidoglycolate dehydrogenase [Pseudorhodoplanes sinuspersici]RKE68619.1 putative oxidoreductase [Pseudorhodoplanes sinuspersici]
MPIVNADRLIDFVAGIFAQLGCSPEESARIGRYLVNANLTGHDSHGVARVPRYASWKRDGLLQADQVVERVVDTPVIAILDGKFGFGQTIAPQAVALGIEKCREHGLSAIGLRNSGHVGRVGEWAEMAAEAGIVSVHFVNVAGSVLVAPFGGIERRFSTAPVCIGMPRPGGLPVILDFATSLVAEGKVLVASQGGKALPANALVSADGQLSGDPRELYGDYGSGAARDHKKGRGALRAFGEHKGSGLALMCELLGGALTGNGASNPDKRWSQGMFSFYVDPAKIDPQNFLPAELSRFLSYVKGTKPIDPDAPVLLPGEPEALKRAERIANGVPLTDDTFNALIATARDAGVSDQAIRGLTDAMP